MSRKGKISRRSCLQEQSCLQKAHFRPKTTNNDPQTPIMRALAPRVRIYFIFHDIPHGRESVTKTLFSCGAAVTSMSLAQGALQCAACSITIRSALFEDFSFCVVASAAQNWNIKPRSFLGHDFKFEVIWGGRASCGDRLRPILGLSPLLQILGLRPMLLQALLRRCAP